MSSHTPTPGDTRSVSQTFTNSDIASFNSLTGTGETTARDMSDSDDTPVPASLLDSFARAALQKLPGELTITEREIQYPNTVTAGTLVTITASITDVTDGTCRIALTAKPATRTAPVVLTGTITATHSEEPDAVTTPSLPGSDTHGTLYFDGASRGNPGTAATGCVLETPDETIENGTHLGEQTNNEAEYNALIEGLELALEHNITTITVRGDSELIIRQVTGEYDCNADNLEPLHSHVQAALEQFDEHTIEHVPRDENNTADGLANTVLDAA